MVIFQKYNRWPYDYSKEDKDGNAYEQDFAPQNLPARTNEEMF